MKYTFIQETGQGDKLTSEFVCEDLGQMLSHFRWFLQGCSFVIRPEEEVIIDQSAAFEPSISGGKKKRKSGS